MLTIYRRHLEACPHKDKGRKHRTCHCPISVQGTLRGKAIRKALDLTSWETAQRVVREWESLGNVSGDVVSVPEACRKYLALCETRNLKPGTIVLRRRFLEKLLMPWCEKQGQRFIGSLGLEELETFRASWKCEPITALKRLERLRHFFRFVQVRGWVDKNPTLEMQAPKVKPKPTLPFSSEEVERIIEACDKYPYRPERMRAFVLLLRHSGLRISDAVMLERKRIENGKLFLYTAKTGTPVWLPLPPSLLESLDALKGERYFSNGNLHAGMTVWDRALRTLFKLAKVEGGHAHRLRDTFATEMLSKGISLENVSILLGHSSIRITEKHYAPFVKSRQIALEAAVMSTWPAGEKIVKFRTKSA